MPVPTMNDNVLPLTPNDVAGSPTPEPLVTVQQYQKITTDMASTVNDVEDMLEEVISDLSRECHRTLIYGQYTEAQRLYPNGMVYPSATPLDVTKPVSAGDPNEPIYNPASDNDGASIIQGDGIWVGWFSPLPSMPVFAGVVPPQTVLTYWGGFTQATLPGKLRRLICAIAFYRQNPVALTGMPGGVKSMSVGGVSISGNLSSFMDEDPQIRRAVRAWSHPAVDAWQT